MPAEDDAREPRSCGGCENLQCFAGTPICVCTGRETRFFHDATYCGAFRDEWSDDEDD